MFQMFLEHSFEPLSLSITEDVNRHQKIQQHSFFPFSSLMLHRLFFFQIPLGGFQKKTLLEKPGNNFCPRRRGP
jgi:hypothetical protein